MGRPTVHNLPQMPLAEWDDEVQTLPPYTAHEPFTYGICLGGAHRRFHDLHTHGCDFLIQLPREDAVMIVNHEPVRMAARQRFAELLQGPLGCGMFGDAVMKNPTGSQFHHDQYIKDAEGGCDHR